MKERPSFEEVYIHFAETIAQRSTCKRLAVGTVITKPFVFEGDNLALNIAADGEARVALLDENGRPIKGFDLHDCDPIRADNVRHIVTWRTSANVGRLAGRHVRLKFELKKAKLYAFQFLPPQKETPR